MVFPLTVFSAAARGDRPAAVNVAGLSLAAFGASLIGSPLIGFVADAAGLRFGLAVMVPLIILGFFFVGELKRRADAPSEAAIEATITEIQP